MAIGPYEAGLSWLVIKLVRALLSERPGSILNQLFTLWYQVLNHMSAAKCCWHMHLFVAKYESCGTWYYLYNYLRFMVSLACFLQQPLCISRYHTIDYPLVFAAIYSDYIKHTFKVLIYIPNKQSCRMCHTMFYHLFIALTTLMFQAIML